MNIGQIHGPPEAPARGTKPREMPIRENRFPIESEHGFKQSKPVEKTAVLGKIWNVFESEPLPVAPELIHRQEWRIPLI
jgi:hypothetical protein